MLELEEDEELLDEELLLDELEELLELEELDEEEPPELDELLVPQPVGLQGIPFKVKRVTTSAGGLELLAVKPKLTEPKFAGIFPFQCPVVLLAVTWEPLVLKLAFQPETKLSPGFIFQTS